MFQDIKYRIKDEKVIFFSNVLIEFFYELILFNSE